MGWDVRMSRHVICTSITTSALAINEQRGVVGFVYQRVVEGCIEDLGCGRKMEPAKSLVLLTQIIEYICYTLLEDDSLIPPWSYIHRVALLALNQRRCWA